jgi:nucleoid-associated protein YgaU
MDPTLTHDAAQHVEEVAGLLLVAVTGWHVVGAVACAATRAFPRSRPARAVARRAPRWVRRLVPAVCGASAVLSHAPFAAAVVEQPVVRAPAMAEAPAPAPPALPTPSRTTPPRTTPPPSARVHVVVAGDNLWSIARAALADATGAPPAARDVAPYWHRVVDANRATLRSGDPDLIHPGELVTLPPLPPG